tara:strand:- start:165 stop:602 length:438 start_codon:yes stop_codon:yes gene_type:complete
MKLKEHIENFEKSLLNEVTTGGAAAEFVGGRGDTIDAKFAGPYHPEFGKIKKLLQQQVDSQKVRREFTDEFTPEIYNFYASVDWKYEFDKEIKKDNSKFKNSSDKEMQFVDLEIDYDKLIDKTEENKRFINNTNDWKYIYDKEKK